MTRFTSDLFEQALDGSESCLHKASLLVGESQRGQAIALLERAAEVFPADKRLLSALGKLYLATGNPGKAAQCFERLLNRQTIAALPCDELPDAEDMEYLDEQSLDLTESEYSVDSEEDSDGVRGEQPLATKGRKVLSLNRDRRAPDGAKIVFKSRASSRHATGTVGDTKQEPVSEPAVEPEIGPVDGISNDEEPVPDGEAEVDQVSPLLSDGLAVADDEDEVDDYFGGYGEGANEELVSTSWQRDQDDNDLEADYFDTAGFIDDGNGEPSSRAFGADWEEELFEQWDDDLADYEEDEAGNDTALDNQISRADRARQAAVESLEALDWDRATLGFVTEVYLALGWNNAKRAFEREVLSGASYDEMRVAFQVKQLWTDSQRYWIAFSGAWVSGESTTATYQICSWPQAIRLIRAFNDIPDFEEVLSLLENEFDYWYSSKVLRLRFPAFSRYLFSYRLNESLPTLSVRETRCFDVAVAFDSLDGGWGDYGNSDEMSALRRCGIELVGRNSPKNYYASDIPFDPRELEPPPKGRKSTEDVFQDEIV